MGGHSTQQGPAVKRWRFWQYRPFHYSVQVTSRPGIISCTALSPGLAWSTSYVDDSFQVNKRRLRFFVLDTEFYSFSLTFHAHHHFARAALLPATHTHIYARPTPSPVHAIHDSFHTHCTLHITQCAVFRRRDSRR